MSLLSGLFGGDKESPRGSPAGAAPESPEAFMLPAGARPLAPVVEESSLILTTDQDSWKHRRSETDEDPSVRKPVISALC